jgi:predicted nucleic acid-binding protein
MKIYLDSCAIQRPLDTPNQVRIVLESEAVLGILNICTLGQAELLSSEALIYEADQSSLVIRKEHTLSVLSIARATIKITDKEKQRAGYLMTFGIKPLDALHIALAETGEADYFCSCDDRLLHSSEKVRDLLVKVVDPIMLIQEIEK